MGRDNTNNTRKLGNVAFQEDAENIMDGQSDQQASDKENEEKSLSTSDIL